MSDAMQTGADRLIGALADNRVELCFANPGTSELDLVLALDREPRMRAVAVAYEGVASGAADGYARIAGKPACTLLHLAPGYLNAAANCHNAQRAGSPIVSIIGDHAFEHRRFDTPLTADLEAIVRPQSIFVRTVSRAEDAAAAGAEAVREAVEQGGQAALIMCADAAWTKTPAVSTAKSARSEPHRSAPAIEAAARSIKRAQRPVALLGGGALSEEGLRSAARISALGVRILSESFPARQARGRGRFTPEKIAYFAEMSIAQLGDADLLVSIGTPAPISNFAYPARPVRSTPAQCAVIDLDTPRGAAGIALGALADALGAPSKGVIAAAAPTAEVVLSDGPLTGPALAQTLALCLPDNAIVSDDGVTASHYGFAATASSAPHDWLALTGGALGQGGPVAVGAAMAAPDRKVICLTGDGAALYTPQSLWTMAREGLDIVVIVAVNRAYEILRIELGRMGETNPGRASRDLLSLDRPAINYCQLANGFGVPAKRAESVHEFDRILRDACAQKGPFLIEAILAR